MKENGMADNTILIRAAELAARNKTHFPNESPEYRQARNALLTEEIELRRHIERVTVTRRRLVSWLRTATTSLRRPRGIQS
jgi:predicted dithiol-disulfide oxidoreductase (DUF899 family)